MAQTKRKRRTKHRGNAAGSVEARGRTGRKPTPAKGGKGARGAPRPPRSGRRRGARPPTASAIATVALRRAHHAAAARPADGAGHRLLMFLAYIPLGLLHRPLRLPPASGQEGRRGSCRPWTSACSPSGRSRRTAFLLRRDGGDRALIVDPGDEAPQAAGRDRGARRHARRDPAHAHALRPRRRRRARRPRRPARPSTAPSSRCRCCRTSWPTCRGRASARSSPGTPSTRVAGGERWSSRASTSTCSSRPATAPATSPTRSPTPRRADRAVLRRRAVPGLGRPHRPARRRPRDAAGARSPTLLERFDDDTVVHPGHMGLTTLGAERAHNPFLRRARAA